MRCHDSRFGSTELNPGLGGGRLHPFRPAPHRRPVPTLYAAGDDVSAASETVFHTVATPGGDHLPRRVFLSRYLSWMWSTIAPTRDLELVDLTGAGLARLGLRREDVVLSPASAYASTREVARSLYVSTTADGLCWESRQSPAGRAVVLFCRARNRGVRRSDLDVVTPPVPFAGDAGLSRLAEIADGLGITLVTLDPRG